MFREVKDVIKLKVITKEPEKMEFELKEESNSTVEEESEYEEPQILVVRRSVRESS